MPPPTFVAIKEFPAATGSAGTIAGITWTDFPTRATGDIVFEAIYREVNAAYTATPAGWTQLGPWLQSTGGFKFYADLWWRRLDGSESGTAIWQWASSVWRYSEAVIYRGGYAGGVPALGTNAQAETAQNANPSHTGITIARSNSALVWFIFNFSDIGNTTAPTGFAYRQPLSTTARNILIYDDLTTVTGASGAVTATLSGDIEYPLTVLLELATEAGVALPYRNLGGTSSGKASVSSWPRRVGDFRTQTIGSLRPRTIGQLRPRVILVKRALVGLSVGRATMTGLLKRSRSLQALSVGRTTVSVALTRQRALTATSVGVASASGTLSKIAAAVYKNLTGSASGVAVTTAAPTRLRRLAAAATGVATTGASLTRARALVATATGLSTTTATVTRKRALTVASAGKATTLGFLDKAGSVFRPLLGTSAGKATVTALLTRQRQLAGTAGGGATVSALLTRQRLLVGISTGSASVSGTLSKIPAVTTGVTWTGDHFQIGGVGTVVLWDSGAFQASGSFPQVTWEEDHFETEAAV